MTPQNFGPWSTSLDAGSRLALSAFWRRRLEILPALAATSPRRKRSVAAACAFIVVLAAAPLLAVSDDPAPKSDDKPAAAADEVHAAFTPQRAPSLEAGKFGDTVQRTVNDNGHGKYLIDLDSGKLFEEPENRSDSDREFFEWMRSRGIDALGQVKSSYKGLIGFDMIAIPIDADSWDQRPGGVIENLEFGDPGTPVTMDARAGVPATFFIQTREGARGVLQIVAINEDDPREPDSIRLRFKPIAAAPAVRPAKNKPDKHNLQKDKPEKPAKSKPRKSKPTAAANEGPPELRELINRAAPHLAALRDKHGYALADDQVLRRVVPPFPDERMEWYRLGNPGQADAIPRGPDAIFFRWERGGLVNNGMQFGGEDVQGLLESVAGIYPQDIEGPLELRKKEVPGDWIVRAGASNAKLVAELQEILNRELSLGIRLRFDKVERDVYVARGDYKFTPLPGQPKVDKTQLVDRLALTDPIQVFGAELVPDSGYGGGMGNFTEFCEWVGRWVGAPLVNEAAGVPREITWSLHGHSPFTKEEDRQARDPELVLENITKQTGLSFTKETRAIDVLIVEPAR